MAFAALAEWNNFYVITGSSAAGLTGLTFVVIALAADASRVNPTGLRSFVTPTIVHFGTVLALAAFLCVPRQTLLSASLGLSGTGIAGLIYIGVIAAEPTSQARGLRPGRRGLALPCDSAGGRLRTLAGDGVPDLASPGCLAVRRCGSVDAAAARRHS